MGAAVEAVMLRAASAAVGFLFVNAFCDKSVSRSRPVDEANNVLVEPFHLMNTNDDKLPLILKPHDCIFLPQMGH